MTAPVLDTLSVPALDKQDAELEPYRLAEPMEVPHRRVAETVADSCLGQTIAWSPKACHSTTARGIFEFHSLQTQRPKEARPV